MAKALTTLPHLEHLDIRDCGVEEGKLKLRGRRLTMKGLQEVVTALEDVNTVPLLEYLDLSLLEIGNETGIAGRIGGLITKKKALRYLVIQENELESAGVVQLVSGMEIYALSGYEILF